MCSQAPHLTPASLPPTSPLAQVHEDYDCTLNQTNIGNNNNKFYIMQLLQDGQHFTCWNRWGRVVSAPPALHILPRVPKRPQLLSGGTPPAVPGHSAQGLAQHTGQQMLMVDIPLKAVGFRER